MLAVVIREFAVSRPPKRSKPVLEYNEAASGRSAQNSRPLLALRTLGSHRSPRPETLVAFHESGDLVVAAV